MTDTITMPSVINSEKSLLGQIFADNSIFPAVDTVIKVDYFYLNKHKLIYMAMRKLAKDEIDIDPLTVHSILANNKEISLTDIIEIAGAEINSLDHKYHAKVIKDRFIRRCFIENLTKLRTDTFDTSIDLDKIIDNITDITNDTLKIAGFGDNTKNMEQLLKETEKDILDSISRGGKSKGRLCGIADLDAAMDGFEDELIVIGARPSCGKTTLSANILRGLAVNYNCLFFSMEQKGTQLITKFLAQETGINAKKISNGDLDGIEQTKISNAIDKLKHLKIDIDERCGIGISEIENAIIKASHASGVDVVCIDYLQYIEIGNDDANKAFGKIVKRLKNITKKYGVCIILLSQLSRKSEDRADKRPVMSDLRDSGSIEQEADKIMLLHREERYDDSTEYKGVLEINLVKNRNGATNNDIKLHFDLDRQLIASLVKKDTIKTDNTVKSNKGALNHYKKQLEMFEVAHNLKF